MPYYVKTYYTNAKKTTYNNYQYDSKFEANYAQELDLRKKAGDIKDWERQKTLELVVNGFIVCTYRVDFVVYHNDGTIEYVETKGWWSPYAKLKFKLFEALFDKPGVKITVVQQGRQKPPKPRRKKTIGKS